MNLYRPFSICRLLQPLGIVSHILAALNLLKPFFTLQNSMYTELTICIYSVALCFYLNWKGSIILVILGTSFIKAILSIAPYALAAYYDTQHLVASLHAYFNGAKISHVVTWKKHCCYWICNSQLL